MFDTVDLFTIFRTLPGGSLPRPLRLPAPRQIRADKFRMASSDAVEFNQANSRTDCFHFEVE